MPLAHLARLTLLTTLTSLSLAAPLAAEETPEEWILPEEALSPEWKEPVGDLVLERVRVWPGAGSEVLEDVRVWVQYGRIVEITPNMSEGENISQEELLPGTVVLEHPDVTLVPGWTLVDPDFMSEPGLHPAALLSDCLLAGVTTLASLDDSIPWSQWLGWAEALGGPRLVLTPQQAPTHSGGALRARTPWTSFTPHVLGEPGLKELKEAEGIQLILPPANREGFYALKARYQIWFLERMEIPFTLSPQGGCQREPMLLAQDKRRGLDLPFLQPGLAYHPARLLGLEGEIGHIVQGRRADFVALDGDPSADPEAWSRVRYVVLNGRIHTPDGAKPLNPKQGSYQEEGTEDPSKMLDLGEGS